MRSVEKLKPLQVCGPLMVWWFGCFSRNLPPEWRGWFFFRRNLKVDAKGQHILTWWSLLAGVISKGAYNCFTYRIGWLQPQDDYCNKLQTYVCLRILMLKHCQCEMVMTSSASIARTKLLSWWFNKIFVTVFICSRAAWQFGRTEMNLLSCAAEFPAVTGQGSLCLIGANLEKDLRHRKCPTCSRKEGWNVFMTEFG